MSHDRDRKHVLREGEAPAEPLMAPAAHERQPKLLDQVRNAIRVRHMSIRTEEAYVGWIRRFILFHGKKHPSMMGAEEISSFLTHLAVNDQVSSSTQNQALSAILFLYKEVLGQEIDRIRDVVRPESRGGCRLS